MKATSFQITIVQWRETVLCFTIDIQITSININIYVFVDHYQYEIVAKVEAVNCFFE